MFENSFHHRVDGSAKNQVHRRVILLSIPNVLYLTRYGLVNTQKILKLIDDERVVVITAITHQFLKQFPERGNPTMDMQPQLALRLLLKLAAQQLLIIL